MINSPWKHQIQHQNFHVTPKLSHPKTIDGSHQLPTIQFAFLLAVPNIFYLCLQFVRIDTQMDETDKCVTYNTFHFTLPFRKLVAVRFKSVICSMMQADTNFLMILQLLGGERGFDKNSGWNIRNHIDESSKYRVGLLFFRIL